MQLTTKQLDEILDLMDKEEALELEDQIEKALEKQSTAEKVQTASSAIPKGMLYCSQHTGIPSTDVRRNLQSNFCSTDSNSTNDKKKTDSEDGSSTKGPPVTEKKQTAAMSMGPNASSNKNTISEPKDVKNDTTKKL